MTVEANLPRLLEGFFNERLMHQRQASPHTIASYRDTFSLLLRFVQERINKAPSTLSLDVVSYCPPIHGDGLSGSKRALSR